MQRLRTQSDPERSVGFPASLARLSDRSLAPVLVVFGWAILFLPLLPARSLYFEEGRRGIQAQAMLETGDWLQPRVFGERYVSKPPLLPWLIAATAAVRGKMDEWSVRLPSVVATLVGALLVYRLAVPYTGPPGALYGAAAFLLSPHILAKATVGETDVTLTVASFAAFAVYWTAYEAGRLSLRHWLAAGLLLGIAALAKGPVGLAFFAAGVGSLVILRREWKQLPGFATAMSVGLACLGAWALAVYEPGDLRTWHAELRMALTGETVLLYARERLEMWAMTFLQLLPWAAVAAPALVPAWRRSLHLDLRDIRLCKALALYAAAFSAILLFWPYVRPRYFMPVAPAVAVATALMVARVWGRNRHLDRVLAGCLVALGAYQLALALVVVPMRADRPIAARLAGQEIARVIAGEPGPVYALAEEIDANMLFYVGHKVRMIELRQVDGIVRPAWIVAPADRELELRQSLPSLSDRPSASVSSRLDRSYVLFRLE